MAAFGEKPMIVHLLVIVLTAALMITGLIGSVLPGLPGSPLIFAGALIYAWHTGFHPVTWATLIWLLVLALLSHFLDFFGSLLGVKKFGGTRWGMMGAFLGGIAGIFAGGIFGLIFGCSLGAILLELIHTRNARISLKSGLGTFLGFLMGTLGKLAIAIIMIGIFLMKITA